MAWPESLTADQQNTVEAFANSLRSFSQLIAEAADLGINLGAAWNGGISTLVNSLQSGDIIPNTSGLAGSQALTPADVINLVGYAINMSDPASGSGGVGGYNTSFIRALYVKAAGLNV